MRHRVFLLLFVSFFSWLLIPGQTFANSKFSLKFDATYKVQDSGITTVSQNFALTNLTSETFASEYRLNLGKAHVLGLRAFDKTGALPLDLFPTDDGQQEVRVGFRDLAVGKETTLNWSIVYETTDIATKSGETWVVTIPKPVEPNAETDYTITLIVPPSFGRPVLLKPTASAIGNFWRKDQLKSNAITAVYTPKSTAMQTQTYDFVLRYRLTNGNVLPATLSLALPPDTAYQTIFLNFLNPRPEDVIVDSDGNWLARYRLGALSHVDVTASGSALIAATPVFPQVSLEPEQFLKPNTIWDKTPKLEQLADSQKDIGAIYSFVLKNITVDPTKAVGEPIPASHIVSQLPYKGSCFDVAAVFVSLARAKGIPARQIDGIVIPRNEKHINKLHCWVEYYDYPLATWRMVDPTWESATGNDYFSTLDFSHLTLAVHGVSPISPIPAGLYKNAANTDDIVITPSTKVLDQIAPDPIAVRVDIPSTATSGLSYTAKLFLENTSPVMQSSETLHFSSPNLSISPQSIDTGALPPFASREVSVTVSPVPFTTSRDGIITLRVGDKSRDYHVQFTPLYTSRWILIAGGLTFLGFVSIVAQITRSVLLQKRKRSSDLRGESKKSS